MKKIFLFVLFIMPSILKASVTDSIPNSSFEVWYLTQWYEFPGSWSTNNTQILAATVVRDTDVVSGQLAMRLTNTGGLQPYASVGFPVTMHHSNVTFFANPLLIPGDSAFVRVYMFDQNQLVDSGSQAIYTGIIQGYTQIVIPISQTNPDADSCLIEFFGGNVYNSDIIIDDISFDFNLGVDGIEFMSLNSFPNPCKNFVNINSSLPDIPESLIAFSANGAKSEIRLVAKKGGYGVYDTSMLSSGLWIVNISENGNTYSCKILKE